MPIRVHCETCNATFNAPDDFDSRHAKCPKCSAPLTLPSQVAPSNTTTRPTGDDLLPCPYCREPIRIGAVKCRYCGEFLDRRGPSKRLDGWDPRIAGALSFFIVGGGQVYKGQMRDGFGIFAAYLASILLGCLALSFRFGAVGVGVAFLLLAAVIWGVGIYDAINNPRVNSDWWRRP